MQTKMVESLLLRTDSKLDYIDINADNIEVHLNWNGQDILARIVPKPCSNSCIAGFFVTRNNPFDFFIGWGEYKNNRWVLYSDSPKQNAIDKLIKDHYYNIKAIGYLTGELDD